ncbi:PAS domain-containing protein [Methanolacinia petrolearia]|uniref:PAS domain-containing protein n=1 Tax=Methanolacinia petrolearia TaxID=54120 RepID=UPI003BAAB07D
MVKLNWSSYTIDLSVTIFLEDFYKAGNFTFSTRYSINLAGKTPEELTDGMKFWDILVEDDRDRACKNLEWFYKGMFLGAVEYRLTKPDGAVIPVMVHFSYDFDDNSAVQCRGSEALLWI